MAIFTAIFNVLFLLPHFTLYSFNSHTKNFNIKKVFEQKNQIESFSNSINCFFIKKCLNFSILKSKVLLSIKIK